MKIIIFGCGYWGTEAYHRFGAEHIAYFCDNNQAMQGREFCGKRILSPKELPTYAQQYPVLICIDGTSGWEVVLQLQDIGIERFFLYSTVFRDKDVMRMDAPSFLDLFLGNSETAASFRRLYWNLVEQNVVNMKYMEKRADIAKINPADGYRRKRQLEEIEFCRELFSYLDELQIKPILDFGNLLGYIRHQGFIPWDDDIDFSLFRRDYEKLIAFCRNNMIVADYHGIRDQIHIAEWQSELMQAHPNQWILIIYAEHIQITKGTSLFNKKFVDFFCLDYFKDNYSFSDHKKLLKSLVKEVQNLPDDLQRKKCLAGWKEKAQVTVDMSQNIFFGLENMGGCVYSLRHDWNCWFLPSEYFPLRKVVFEGLPVYIPNQPDKILSCEYGKYMDWPEDMGWFHHDYVDQYREQLFLTVEFYLIDAFEIDCFLPFYRFLRKHGVSALFVAESPQYNTVSSWFDYNRAIRRLDEEGLEYHDFCDPHADVAFSTQVCRCLGKYSKETIKINLTYGVSMLKNTFFIAKENICGYDYKFVYGDFYKKLCEKELDSDRVKVIGYPKYYDYDRTKNQKKKNVYLQEIGFRTKKRIICYLPTWDECSSISAYAEQLDKLKKEFYLVIKPHHCTWRLDEKRGDLQILKEMADCLLPPTYPLYKVASIADMVIADAKSGVTVELAYLNPDTPALWICVNKDKKKDFYPDIEKMADVINAPSELTIEHIEKCLRDRVKRDYRKNGISRYIAETGEENLKDIFGEILKGKERVSNNFQ